MLRKLLKISILSLTTLIVFILLLEISYRYQWFDFYKAEFTSLNKPTVKANHIKNIIVCGDSFTADPESYVSVLRDSLGQYQVINTGVPGSSIKQHSVFLPSRIKKYNPRILIYQFYAGNDLFEISHPYQFNSISILRKLYWFLSDRIHSLAFLNFRFAGFRYRYYDDAGGNYSAKALDTFSVSSYSKREKFNYNAEPHLVENTLFLKNGREADWQYFRSKFSDMIGQLDDSVSKYFIFIPHESMLSDSLRTKHISLGAAFSKIGSLEYPLIKEIQTLCTDHNIHFINFAKPTIDSSLLKKLFYANDPHLSRFGQQALGNQILGEIRKNDFR